MEGVVGHCWCIVDCIAADQDLAAESPAAYIVAGHMYCLVAGCRDFLAVGMPFCSKE